MLKSSFEKIKIINQIMDEVIEYIEQNFQIVERYKHDIYKIIIDDEYYILLIPEVSRLMLWDMLPSFEIMSDKYTQRIIDNYRLCSTLNLGPKLYRTFNVNGFIVLIMEYFPFHIPEEMVNIHPEIFTSFIAHMHGLGIFHGDLHTGNLMLDKNHQLRIIDFETMFYLDELDLVNDKCFNPLIQEHIEDVFNIKSINEFIDWELNHDWKRVRTE